jgi:AcrR family transcriptional regulator
MPDEPVQRVLDAAIRCVSRWGMAKTSVEDIAREAGISRATLYRLFPGGRDVLFEQAGEAELARIFGLLARDLRAAPDLRELLVTGVQQASRAIRDHDALQYLLAHEPEHVLPFLAFDALDPILVLAAEFAAPFVTPHLGPDAPEGLDLEVAEWLTRLVIGCALDPSRVDDLTRRQAAERVIDRFVLPGVELALAEARAADRPRPRAEVPA